MSLKTGFFASKKPPLTGLPSNRSIAFRAARACHDPFAELAFSDVGERFKDRTADSAIESGSALIVDRNVASNVQIDRRLGDRAQAWPAFDGFVRSIGFAPRDVIVDNFLTD
jgi:enoyl-[acyl-carrier protein] reductase I